MRLGCTCDRGSHAWGQPYNAAVHCPACWTFWHNAQHNQIRGGDGRIFGVASTKETLVPLVFPPAACGYRGSQIVETDHCHTCKGRIEVPLLDCSKLGKTCYTGSYTVTGSQSCDRCLVRETRLTSDPKAGVVIGSYKWPRVVEANIKLIRHTCGDVPILVSDDCSKEQETLKAVCRYHNVDFVSTPEWYGHVRGDAAAFAYGLRWAKDRGLDVLAKVSMRLWWLQPRWLQRGATDLLKSDKFTSTRPGNFESHTDFPLRSESMLLRVDRWNDSTLLDGPFHPLNGEQVIYLAMPGGEFHMWDDLAPNRLTRASNLMSHWTHEEHEYRTIAKRVGVTLEPSFHGSGWELEHARGEYKWG